MAPTSIALLTDRRYVRPVPRDRYVQNIFTEDRLLGEALARQGVTAVRRDWADPEVDWSKFSAAVFRTTWDYFDRFDSFVAWLDRVQKQTRLLNPPALVRWNLDKHYLAELQAAGVPVVRTVFIERGEPIDLCACLDEQGWDEVVVKPTVSGAARHTYRVGRDDAQQFQSRLQTLVAQQAMMIQPFVADVVERGEVTLVFFGDRYTHAILKRPAPGDFRVQDDHGGTVHAYTPTADEVEFARAAILACPSLPAYGRVDLVRDETGAPAVMELELVEPELWLRMHPPAAELMAASLLANLTVAEAPDC